MPTPRDQTPPALPDEAASQPVNAAVPPSLAGGASQHQEPRATDSRSGEGASKWSSEGAGGVIAWLRSKLEEAEKSLRAREQMEKGYRTGTDEEWEAAAKMHPSTAGKPRMTRADRLKESATQGRIAVKCRRDVEMFTALLTLVGGGGGFETAASEPTGAGAVKGVTVLGSPPANEKIRHDAESAAPQTQKGNK